MTRIIIEMKTRTIHVRLDDEATYKRLAAEAKFLGLPISTYIRMVLKEKSNGLGKKEN